MPDPDDRGLRPFPLPPDALATLVREGIVPAEAVVDDVLRPSFRLGVDAFVAARRTVPELKGRPPAELHDGRLVVAPQWELPFNYAASELVPLLQRACGRQLAYHAYVVPLRCDPWTALSPALTVLPWSAARPAPASDALLAVVVATSTASAHAVVDKLAVGGLATCWRLDPFAGTLDVLTAPGPDGFRHTVAVDPMGTVRAPGASEDVVVRAMFLPRVRQRLEGAPVGPPPAVEVVGDPALARTPMLAVSYDTEGRPRARLVLVADDALPDAED